MNKFSPVMDINLALMLEAEQDGMMPVDWWLQQIPSMAPALAQ